MPEVICLYSICLLLLTNVIYAELECNENNKFRIVQFTDTHFGESNIGNHLTLSLMNKILDAEIPDLVVLSGDIISGYSWNGQQGWFSNLWNKIVTPMIKRNIPWIFTPGNHDREGEFTKTEEIMELEKTKYSHLGSMTEIGFMDEQSGQNVYNVNIHKHKKDDPVATIWFCSMTIIYVANTK